MKKCPHIVIVGCGFGGLAAAKALGGQDCEVTVVDRSNHHLFQPLLYQVATAGLAAPAIAAPVRHILGKHRNVRVLMDEVEVIELSRRLLRCASGPPLSFDALILAAGATHSYFGNSAWAAHAPGLKTLDDAMLIRQRVLNAFERAELQAAASKSVQAGQALRFVVIGAGPTGVEMAGTMAEIARHTFGGEFRHIDPAQSEVLLIEGGARVLPSFSEKLSQKALEQLQALGVKVMLSSRVTGVDAQAVEVERAGQRERFTSACTVWAAGVQASATAQGLGVALARSGRVAVRADLTVEGLPRELPVFVIGDMAAASSEGKAVPGVSPAAKQMGRLAARNALALLSGQPTQPFRYADYGSLATIGRKSAVAQLGRLEFSGLPAWLFWLFVHVFFLIGFKNRLLVMTEWAWSYLTFARAARVFGPGNRRDGVES